MPGTLGYSWHEGSRGEYLAQYFLTALGVSAPVIRQEDIGVDFYCSLAREENRRLTFHSPYMVQHGASSGSKEFIYGGYSDKGKWRGEGIDWLFSQELPLFVCTVDREKARCRLYSTSAMWLVRYQFGKVTQVELCPEANHNALTQSQSEKIGRNAEDGDGYSYRVPLGNPIVDLTVFDFEKETRTRAIEALEIAIQVESRNLTCRRLGVHLADWFTSIVPNNAEPLLVRGGSVFWNRTPGENVARQLEALRDVAIPLALNYHAQGATSELAKLAPVFRLVPKESIAPWVLEQLPPTVIQNLQWKSDDVALIEEAKSLLRGESSAKDV